MHAPITHVDSRVRLDIRPIAPKDRMQTLLGAYTALARAATLDITFDHDPECLYYTLQATEPKDSFTFHYLRRGPELWRVEVVKR
jgi:uncharacterized protein (DUF2249 family)